MKYNRSAVIRALCTILISALLIVFPLEADRWLVMGIGALFLVPGIVSVIAWLARRRSLSAQKNIASAAPATSVENQTQPTATDIEPASAAAGPASQTGAKSAKPTPAKTHLLVPVIGVGSILFGIILLLYPDEFRRFLLFILGAFLILAGIAQSCNLARLSRLYRLGAFPFVVALMISLAGVTIILLKIFNGTDTQPLPNGEVPTLSVLPSYIFGVAGIIYGVTEIIYAIQFRHSDNRLSQAHNGQTVRNAFASPTTQKPDEEDKAPAPVAGNRPAEPAASAPQA